MADRLEDSSISTPVEDTGITEKKADFSLTEKPEIHDLEVAKGFVSEKDFEGHVSDVPLGEGIVPDDDDEFIDPRLKDYPIALVAKTVDLRNDPTQVHLL